MKVVIQKGTGLDEQVLIEMDLANLAASSQHIEDAFDVIDNRLR